MSGMIIEGKKYLSGRNRQRHTPRSQTEKAFALSLGLGNDIPLQFLSNALKTLQKALLSETFVWTDLGSYQKSRCRFYQAGLDSFKGNSNEESYSFRKRKTCNLPADSRRNIHHVRCEDRFYFFQK